VVPDDLAQFACSLRSLWALDVLNLLYRSRPREWTVPDVTRELRSSDTLVEQTLALLEGRGLVARDASGLARYQFADPATDDLVARLMELYKVRPVALIDLIYSDTNQKLRILSNAFRLKKD